MGEPGTKCLLSFQSSTKRRSEKKKARDSIGYGLLSDALELLRLRRRRLVVLWFRPATEENKRVNRAVEFDGSHAAPAGQPLHSQCLKGPIDPDASVSKIRVYRAGVPAHRLHTEWAIPMHESCACEGPSTDGQSVTQH